MANPNENRINITIAPADVLTIDTSFTGINTALDPYTQALTEDERESLFSVAEENEVFADDALQQERHGKGSKGCHGRRTKGLDQHGAHDGRRRRK